MADKSVREVDSVDGKKIGGNGSPEMVLSIVADDDSFNGGFHENGIPVFEYHVPMDVEETNAVLVRMMQRDEKIDASVSTPIILCLSNRNWTLAGAEEMVKLIEMDVIAKNIVGVELIGVIGDYACRDDAKEALSLLVKSLVNASSFNSVKLTQLSDDDVNIFFPLMTRSSVTHIWIGDSDLDIDGGLLDIKNCLVQQVSGSSFRPCETLKTLFFQSVVTCDDGNDSAKTYGEILENCPSVEYIKYSVCRPGLNGSQDLAEALRRLVESTPDVKASVRYIDFQGCMLKMCIRQLVETLVSLSSLEYLNLCDCGLTHSQKKLLLKELLGRQGRKLKLVLYGDDFSDSDSD